MNLTEVIRVHFGYPPLLKIDPKTQETVSENAGHPEHAFSQAAIPAILTGLYKYASNDEGAANILSSNISSNWVKELFEGYDSEIIDRVSNYSGNIAEATQEQMNEIAKQAILEIRKAAAPANDLLTVKKLIADQRSNFLPYLPVQLHVGELVDDTTIDDKTNKMEGPVSNLMKKIGEAFSKPDEDERLTNEV